jgi:hypothetical protein
MKNVKKALAMLLAIVLVFGMVACGEPNTSPTETNPEQDPTIQGTEDVAPTNPDDETAPSVDDSVDEPLLTDTEYRLLALFNAHPVEFPVMTWNLSIDDDEMIKSFTGLDDTAKIVEASVTEPAMSSQAYSVVLVQVADGVDAETVANEMKTGVNPRKWICVEADEIETVVVDNYVLLVMMASDLSETISATSLVGAYVTLMETYEAPDEVATAPTTTDIESPVDGE